MKLWWSSVLPLAATLCLSIATPNVAKAQSGPKITITGPQGTVDYSPRLKARRPGLINPLCGLVGGPAVSSADCDSQSGREWEGIASTDYFTYEPNVYSPPNPDIAVGPDDILTVVNRTIARYPNPNAPAFDNNGGTAPVTYTVANTYFYSPTSRQFLDVWLGEAALNELCPTFPRSFASCQIEDGSVRYDQLQGRFLVLYTIVDTGLVNCNGCVGVPTQTTAALRRKASWILVSSRWATGCQGTVTSTGVNVGTGCTPDTTPATPGIPGNTTFFTTPQPPGANQGNANSGGINGNWVVYYGTPDGSCETGCAFGNVNSISDLLTGATFTGARTIDCNNTAVGDSTRVCYFPSSARLGLDNDNIVISSSVYNDNVPLAVRGYTVGTNGLVPAWEGTRTRVYKKAAIYIGATSTPGCTTTLCPGAAQATTKVQGDFYDLFDTATPYTFDRLVTRDLPAGGTQTMMGLNYEPQHTRGRSLASYNGNGNLDNQFSVLIGAVDQGTNVTGTLNPPQTLLYHRAITYTRTVAGTISANVSSIPATVNLPAIVGGIPTLGALSSHTVPQFFNPNDIVQRDKLTQVVSGNNQLPTPYLYIGDDRPHRVISREGHLYVARVGIQGTLSRFDGVGGALNSTVIYDIVQKLTPAATALEIYNTSWGNGRYYAPMHDTPANVVQYGSISPINVQPFLEKLFVGTTFPPLAPSDPRTFHYGNIAGQALAACKGQEPSVSTSTWAYPGLFDIRCGEDAYDTAQAYRHPVTGAFTPTDFQVDAQPTGYPNQIVPFGIRGGAATDVNNLGLWLYGAYAKGRLASVPGFGQWGTYVAHYPLTFPLRDPYNNSIGSYSDVPPGHPFFTYIQIAKQTEIQPGSRSEGTFNVSGLVTRAEMARWTMRAQMDESSITAYINSTGGIFCSFADVACPGASGATATNSTGTSGDWRYIEVMYRRGYTKGCDATNDGQRRFCPTRNLSRGEMAVFIVRAKMNSVFPTVTSGAFTTTSCQPPGTQVTNVGDQYGLYVGCSPYFADVANTHPYYSFIQKMRELRVSNGTTYSTPTTLGNFTPDGTLTRGELMTFLVRAFFP